MALDPLRPGDMRDKVSIQAPARVSDGAGGYTTGWSEIAAPWAEVTPINGGETFRLGVERATQFYRLRIWFRADVTPGHRIVMNGFALNIRSVDDPDRRRSELLIMAERGVADA